MSSPMTCPRCWGSTREPPPSAEPCGHCLGAGVVLDQVLSPHFMLSELLHSDSAVRKGLPNDPPPGYVDRLAQLADQLLEPLHDQFGRLHVNSGYRSPVVNRDIGGSPTSAHCEAWAADLKPLEAGVTRRALIEWLRTDELAFDQVIWEGTWAHVALFSPSGAQRRGVLMMFPGPDGKPEYFPYDPADPRVVG